MVGGKNIIEVIEKVLIIWFCLILIKFWVEFIKKFILLNKNV